MGDSPPVASTNKHSSTNLRRIKEVPMGDSPSVATHNTHEMSPPTLLRNSEGRRSLWRTLKTHQSTQNLVLPCLDLDVEKIEQPNINIWTSKFMKAIYISLAAAYLCRNSYLLYGIPLFVLFETAKLLKKWTHFFADDPQMINARAHFATQHKLAMKEANRTQKGGYLRRRQEFIIAALSQSTMDYGMNYLGYKSDVIRQRTREEHNRFISSYGVKATA